MKSSDLEERMQKCLEAVQRSFNTIRTGRASASLLDRVEVEYYGSPMPLNQVAGISIPDASSIVITPFDASAISNIERGISLSDVGIPPNNDGKVIRLNIPPLTEERRKEFAKTASKYAEDGKVALRNVRREAIDEVRKLEKASELSKDESRDKQDEIQKITDKFSAKIDDLLKKKEADIMEV